MIMEVAHELHRPLPDLLDEMTHQELSLWASYFNQRPIGWREDQRAANIMASTSGSEDCWKHFASLVKMREHDESVENAPTLSLIKSGFLDKLKLEAREKGIDWNPEVEDR